MRYPQHRGMGQRRFQLLGNALGVVDQPDPVETVLVLAQAFTQLALQVEVAFAGGVAGAAGHAEQQPLPLEAGERYRMALQVGGRERRERPLWIDQLAVDAAPFRPHHVVGEVGGHYRRRADGQQQQHLPAAGAGAARILRQRRGGRWQGVNREAERLVGRTDGLSHHGRPGRAVGGQVGQFGTTGKGWQSGHKAQTTVQRTHSVWRRRWPARAIRAADDLKQGPSAPP